MKLALELAKKGLGRTAPNPMVGCVVVKDGKIMTEGYHQQFGDFHAERNALMKCDEDLTGADLYVTLEPCCHHGKTPPCTDIIIERGIGRVFIGAMDPNPMVSGKGAQILRDHGIEVETGILEKECLEINENFLHYMIHGIPYIAMKYAMTLDGKIATFTGDSKWVTGEEARGHVQHLRKKYSAIMVGIGTVLVDDPMLNCRIDKGVDPVRVICDSNLRIPMESQIVKTARHIPTIVAHSHHDHAKEAELKAAGVELLYINEEGHVNFRRLVEALAKKGIDSVLVEGGGTFHGTVLKSGLVDRIYCYIAPKLIGGKEAKSPVEGIGFSLMKEAIEIDDTEILKLGRDICITGKVRKEKKED
ncbi:MAG: bifunctional diaminohydroxyphosphoribosylaminopyrimidine deaminase/5-amino-6-(5-phosphoribosylamino)uracil reductase RibD [Eubacterium sp.]|nr:bifunctional diaminohydroxyphosphoribosylaminopyrimidine deaminase/5-amino-6-(5-phosphoribosylamino)uracil reductase RibD [Eubacterium sp.]